jgi:hypothetical protein
MCAVASKRSISGLEREIGAEWQVGHPDDSIHRSEDLITHIGSRLSLGEAGNVGRFFGLASMSLLMAQSVHRVDVGCAAGRNVGRKERSEHHDNRA